MKTSENLAKAKKKLEHFRRMKERGMKGPLGIRFNESPAEADPERHLGLTCGW